MARKARLPGALPPYIARLREQHRNMERVLTLIRLQADSLRPVDNGSDLRLIGNAVAYMAGYSTQGHELSEDILCERLISRAHAYDSYLARFAEQRKSIARLRSDLRRHIRYAREQAPHAHRLVRETGVGLCQAYAAHIYGEENELLPRAYRLFEAQDWDEVERQLSRRMPYAVYPELDAQDNLNDFLMGYDEDRDVG